MCDDLLYLARPSGSEIDGRGTRYFSTIDDARKYIVSIGEGGKVTHGRRTVFIVGSPKNTNYFNNIEFHRSDNGKLPSCVFPGGYPVYYIAKDGGVICPKCANSKECGEADPECREDDQWCLVSMLVNYEDVHLHCDNCGEIIESAY